MIELLDILKTIRTDIDFENEEHLIDDGILDSFDIISIVSELNENYNIDIGVNDLLPENFNSVYAIYNLVEKLRNN